MTQSMINPYLELLGLLDSDLDLGDVSEPGATQKGNLLSFGQGVGVLGVNLFVAHAL